MRRIEPGRHGWHGIRPKEYVREDRRQQVVARSVRMAHWVLLARVVVLAEQPRPGTEHLERIDQAAAALRGQPPDRLNEVLVLHVVRVETGIQKAWNQRRVVRRSPGLGRPRGHPVQVEQGRLRRDSAADVVRAFHQQQAVAGLGEHSVDARQSLRRPLGAHAAVVDGEPGNEFLQARRVAGRLPLRIVAHAGRDAVAERLAVVRGLRRCPRAANDHGDSGRDGEPERPRVDSTDPEEGVTGQGSPSYKAPPPDVVRTVLRVPSFSFMCYCACLHILSVFLGSCPRTGGPSRP